MTAILLIRHGQASFGADSYDRLCPLGERQARLVGAALRAEGRLPGASFSGRLVRQAETARLALAEAAHDPAVTDHAAFDEYPSDVLFQDYLPAVTAADPDLSAVTGQTLRADRRLFQKALAGVLARWQAGAPCSGESWATFRQRVRDGLEAAVAGRGRDDVVAVFTSGGVIGTAVGEVLGLAPDRAIGLSYRLYNASITELGYGRSGFSLAAFNGVSHLRRTGGGEMLTYR